MVSWGGVVLWCSAGLPMDSIGGNGGMAGSRKHAACMVGGLAARGEWEESYYRGATLRTTRGSCQLQAEALHSLKYTISCFCRCQSPTYTVRKKIFLYECIYEISKWSFSYSNKTRYFKMYKSYYFTMFVKTLTFLWCSLTPALSPAVPALCCSQFLHFFGPLAGFLGPLDPRQVRPRFPWCNRRLLWSAGTPVH